MASQNSPGKAHEAPIDAVEAKSLSTWYIVALVVCLLSGFSCFGQKLTEFTNLRMRTDELEAHLRKISGEVTYTNCVFVGAPPIVPGLPNTNVYLPKDLTSVLFRECVFPESTGIYFESTNTGLELEGIHNINNVEISTNARVSILNSSLNYILINRSDVEGVPVVAPRLAMLNTTVKGSITINRLASSKATVSIFNCSIGAIKIHGSRLFSLGSARSTNFLRKDDRYLDAYVLDSLEKQNRQLSFLAQPHRMPKLIRTGYSFQNVLIDGSTISEVILDDVHSENENAGLPIHHCEIGDLAVTNSDISNLDLSSSTLKGSFTFSKSTIGELGLYRTSIATNNIPGLTFDKLKGKNIFIFDPSRPEIFSEPLRSQNGSDSVLTADYGYHYSSQTGWNNPLQDDKPRIDTVKFSNTSRYKATTDAEIQNVELFNELINQYAQLNQIYRLRGDIISSNLCYAEMKDIQTEQLRVIYNQRSTFNNYIRWQLARMVKLYTNHGTDPAKAIVISFWVIVCFGVFYFFFPSDWDITSKTRLITDFKSLREKKNKAYLKGLAKLSYGFFISLLNAITLSLNSFVTLGFGNIPTHGLARYVTILEGFFGWFLLSIFTVALINQVLA